MEIQMILREIGIERHVEVHARHALERERVGGHLHDHVRAARVRHPAEELLKLIALGRGELRGQELLSDHVPVRADEPDLRVELRFEHVLDKIARGRLSARAGDADEGHLLHRIAEEIAACEREPQAAVADLDVGRSVRGRILAEDGRRAFFHRRGDKAVAVGGKSLDGDEKIARLGPAGVVADAADLRIHVRRGGDDLDIS